LARIGSTTVLNRKVLATFWSISAHMASPSSPVLRTKVCSTNEFVTPRWKFRPSAVWSRMRQPTMRRLFIGPSTHTPTLLCCIQTLDTSVSDSAPPIALTWSPSLRSLTSPMIAKSASVTFRLPPAPASRPYQPIRSPAVTLYHGPAPRTVTWSTMMCRVILKVPRGIHTSRPAARAAAMVASKALEASTAPVGSAP
jgi:hypothetical protein